MAKHASVGRVRNIGLFGIIELVKSRDTMEPLSPYNVTNDVMRSIDRYLLDHGVLAASLRSDGAHKDKLFVDGGPSSTGTVGHLRMEGREVFKHAVGMMVRRPRSSLVLIVVMTTVAFSMSTLSDEQHKLELRVATIPTSGSTTTRISSARSRRATRSTCTRSRRPRSSTSRGARS